MWGKVQEQVQTPEHRFRPSVGRDFDIQAVHAIEARTRGFLSRAIAFSSGGALAVSGTYGIATGNFVGLEVVWAVAGPMCGALVTHYFGSAGRNIL
jgi:hypothetical protein